MNFLTDKIRPIYFKYLAAAFGSALISAIYGVVDAAMVGQYQGPTGSAALAVVAPVWNIIYSLGLLTGIGGSVLFSTIRGKAASNEKESNEYFSAAVIGTVVLALLIWAALSDSARRITSPNGTPASRQASAHFFRASVRLSHSVIPKDARMPSAASTAIIR